jgi:hypothetical protein
VVAKATEDCKLRKTVKHKTVRDFILSLSVVATVFYLILSNTVLPVDNVIADTFVVPCTIDTYGDSWDGYLAFGLMEYDTELGSSMTSTYLVIMNTTGDMVVFSKSAPGWNYLVVKKMAEDTLMYQGDPVSTVHFWNFTTNEIIDFEGIFVHHDVEYNPVTETFLALRDYRRDVNGTDILFDKIVELSNTSQILWTWDTYDYLDLEDACPFNDTFFSSGQLVSDFTHSNTLQWNYNENIIYLNARNLNTFYAINKTTGELIWGCGEHGDFKLFDKDGAEVSSLWYHGHSLKEVEENVFIIFDNDYHNQTNSENAHSRILEITIDEENMTARESWSWSAPVDLWSQYWGDADRLPNGNRIGVFGTQLKPYNSTIGAVLAEVDPQGNLVKTYTFPRGWGIYRIEELPTLNLSSIPTPTPSPSPFPTPTPTPYVSITPTPSPSPSPSPTPSPSPSPSPIPTQSPSPSPSPTQTPSKPFNMESFSVLLIIAGIVTVVLIALGLRHYFRKRGK